MFFKRRATVTRLPARFYILVTALCVRVIIRSRNAAARHKSGLVASLVLCYQLCVLRYPQRYAKTEALWLRLRSSKALSNFAIVLDRQAKILEAVMDSNRELPRFSEVLCLWVKMGVTLLTSCPLFRIRTFPGLKQLLECHQLPLGSLNHPVRRI